MKTKNVFQTKFLLRTFIVLMFIGLTGFSTVLAQTGTVTSTVSVSDETPVVGEVVTVDIYIDMTGVVSPDNKLGSFTGTLFWDPAVLNYASYTGAPPTGFTGVVNTEDTGSGNITFNGANVTGSTGNIVVINISFNVVGTGFSDLDLQFSSMAATTFQSLLSILSINDGSVTAAEPPAPSPLVLDGTVSSASGDDVSSLSFSHTTGTGANRLMMVGVSWNCGTTNRTISSVTFTPAGGSAVGLSEIITQLGYNSTNPRYSAIYSLLNPASGQAGTVTVTFSGSVTNGIMAGAANFAGVDQTTPLGTPSGASGTSSASPSLTLSGLNGNELVFDNVFQGAASSSYTLTAGPDQTQLWNPAYVANLRAAASTKQATGSSVSMSWTASTTNYWAITAVAINPATIGTTHNLTMAVSPVGGGTTTPAVGGPYIYAENTVVNINATANPGFTFTNWSGDVAASGSSSTSVTMDDNQFVTANFTQNEYSLTLNTVGFGSISKTPNQATYHYGDLVQLTATPTAGYVFTGWTGDLVSTDNPANITISGNHTVTATFVPEYALSVGNDGNGTITLDPSGGTYVSGTTVTLIPVPNSGFKFDSWEGDDAVDVMESGGVYSIVMDDNKSVSAIFSAVTLYLDGEVSSNTIASGSSISIPHTTGIGINRCMLVGVSWNCGTTNRTISSVTFTPTGGSAVGLLEVITQLGYNSTNPRYSAIYSLLNPASGQAGTVTVTFSGSVTNGIMAGAANFAGVDQTTPLGTPSGASGTSSASPNITLTGLNGNELVFDNVFQGAGSSSYTLTAGPDQTQLWNPAYVANLRAAASTKQATGSSVTMSWTASTTNYWAIAAVPINPATTTVQYTITASAGANGSITPSGAVSVTSGSNQPFTIAANSCYQIATVLIDGVNEPAAVASGSYTFTNVSAAHTISATFTPIIYTITSSAGANGSISPAGSTIVNCGANQIFNITPNGGFNIQNVLVDGISQGAVSSYTFSNVAANHTISATFIQGAYTITSSAGANGSITPSGDVSVTSGSSQAFTIVADPCYKIATVLIDGVNEPAAVASGTYTFTNVSAAHTISATFTPITYSITSSAGANGSISPAGSTIVNCGANQIYNITPNGGFNIQNVLVDGISQGAVSSYTFSNVVANHTISATFIQGAYTITASAGANGSITPSGAVSVTSGSNQPFTIAANSCYQIATVLIDGVNEPAAVASGSYTFTNVSAAHTISATFTPIIYTITSSAGANGSISQAGSTIVNCGANQSFTITPSLGYQVENVLVDGSSVGALTTYEFTNVTSNHTISASFEIISTSLLGLDGTVSSGTGAPTSSSVSFSHTTGTGANRLMMVGISWNCGTTNRTISAITFTPNGGSSINLTEVRTQQYTWTTNNYRYAAIYSLLNPGSGITGTVNVTFSGAVSNGIIAGAANFAGVNQTTPLGTSGGAVGTGTSTSGTPNPAVSLSGLNGNELVFDCVFMGTNSTSQTMTADAGQSELYNILGYSSSSTSFNTRGAASIKQVTGTSATMSWTTDGYGTTATRWAIAAVPINPTVVGPTHTLVMAANPAEGGTTTPAVGGPYSYPENEVVNITAIAAPGYTFAGWVGEVASSGSSSTTVTMNANKTVTANFTPNEYTLNVSVVGNGTVDRTPDQTTYHYGDVVSLAATADAGWVFDGWSGDLNGGVNPANIAMNENKSITATFVEYTQSLLDLDGAVSFNSGDDINSLTINHTTGTGTDRLMLVGVSWNCGTADRTISSVTFTPTGGSAVGLSEVITQLGYNTTNPRYSAIYSLLNPPSGQAGTVTITFSGSVSNGIVAGAANFKGVDQTTPLGISNGAAATAQGTAPGVTLTGLSGNEFVFDNVFMGASDNTQTLTIGTDQTQLWSGFAGNTRASSSIKEATGNSATMNWTAASTGWWAITAVAINPAPSSGTTFGLTMAATGNGTTTPYVGTHNYAENTVVSLSATADAGWSFSNWSGNISGSANPTSITMDGNKSVTANFIENSTEDIIISSVVPSVTNPEVNDQITVDIYINMTNMTSPNEKLGSFTGSLDWDASVLSYVSSSSLATGFSGATNPSSGHLAFNGANASGATGNILMLTITFDVVGSGVCDLDLAYSAMAAAGSFTDLIQFLTVNDASIEVAQPPMVTLSMLVSGNGSTNPAVGNHEYAVGTIVNISALPSAGYVFDSWTGEVANSGSANTTVTMNTSKTVTANFVEAPVGSIIYLGEIGKVSSNAAGTTLQIPVGSAGVAVGNTIIVGFASRGAATYNQPTVTDTQGNIYTMATVAVTYQHGRSYVYYAHVNKALVSGNTITITTSSVGSRVAVAAAFSGLAEVNPLDQKLGYPSLESQSTVQGNSPSAGPSGMTSHPDELIIGVIGTEEATDAGVGTWLNSFVTGPQIKTSGADYEWRVSMGYKIVSSIDQYTAAKTVTNNPYWAANVATFRTINVLPPLTSNIVLARPTNESVTASLIMETNGSAYIEYGTSQGNYSEQTDPIPVSTGVPVKILIDGLVSNSLYFYRLAFLEEGTGIWNRGNEYSFHTQRATNESYTFTITSDSHLGATFSGIDPTRYEQATYNIATDKADFHLDLGDAFLMNEATNQTQADAVYGAQRDYFGNYGHSSPVFIAIGNHENEEGWNFDDSNSKALLSVKARKKYFPNPIPDDFYTGNSDLLPAIGGDNYREDYYSWEWGDALFIVIDPFQYTMTRPYGTITGSGEDNDESVIGDQWDWTLGPQQYEWFRETLENSSAKYKFVFSHHVVGGQLTVTGAAGTPGYVRGGALAVPYFEWGGQNANGTWGFDAEHTDLRFGDDPIHQLMLDNGVNAFFHGHDHQFVHEERDGIVYQLVPSPSMTDYGFDLYDASSYVQTENSILGNLPNAGHLRVNVSSGKATVEYVRASISGDGVTNGSVSYAYDILPAISGPTLNVSPSGISLEQESGSNGTFNITSNTSWSISDDSDWLSVSPVSGSNNGTITVTANSANAGIVSRIATVTITGTGVAERIVTVTQSASPVASNTLGNTEVYSGTTTAANRRALPVTFSESGSIQSISIYHNGGTGSLLLGVYSDQSGSPASRIGVTAATIINPTAGWQTVTLTNPVGVASGQTVWLGWVFENSPGVRYATGTPGRAQSLDTWSSGMPATFGTSTISSIKFSIYCTYTTGAGLTLSVTPSGISLEQESGSNGTFNITSNTSWSISDDSDWLSVSPVSGSNNGTITVTANSANTGIVSRIATVTITGTGVAERIVTVTQSASPVASNTLGNTEVYSGTTTAANRRALPVTFSESGSIQSISIYHNGGTGSLLLGVYSDQSGSPASRIGVTAATIINPTAGWQTVTLTNPVGVASGQTVWLGWVFENSPGVRYATGTPGRAQSLDTWSSGMPATFGTFTISSIKFSIYCTYTTGAGLTLSVTPSGISLEQESGSNGTFNITSNTSWSINDDADWLSVSPVSGSNNGTITVTANSANAGIVSRTATVTITGTGVVERIVTITQSASPVASNTLGNTEVYSGTTTAANRRALPVTFSESGSIQSISIYHNGGTGSLLLGVYSDQSGSPASRIGVTAATIINPTAGWQTVTLTNPVGVASGQTVWLGWVFENSPGVRYATGTPGRAQSLDTWSSGMPATFGTSTISSIKFSIYCTYTTGAGLTLSVTPSGISLEQESGSNGTFNITSNTSWSINDDADWLSVSPVSGSNNGTITVTANSANAGIVSRTATVTITGTGVVERIVTVTQSASPVASNTLGNTEVYSGTTTAANRRALPVTFSESGSIQSISIYHNGGTGSLLLGVYSDQSGSPASRIGVTAATIINPTAGWQTVTLTNPVGVASGQTVWLGWVFENSPGVRYATGTPGRAQSLDTWSSGMPATFGTSTISSIKFSIYCTYTTGTFIATSELPKSAEIVLPIDYSASFEAQDLKVYPNPFSQKLNFEFVSGNNAYAILEIYNLMGQSIERLMDKQVEGGVLNRIEFVPSEIISGIYIYKLTLDGKVTVGKVIYKK